MVRSGDPNLHDLERALDDLAHRVELLSAALGTLAVEHGHNRRAWKRHYTAHDTMRSLLEELNGTLQSGPDTVGRRRPPGIRPGRISGR